jgi:hypothetical protein
MSGQASATVKGFFHEVKRALEIPYDSISWNIFNEAFYDLTWIPADGYLLAVDTGDRLLEDAAPDALNILGEIVTSPAESHFSPESTVVPRHLLIQAAPDRTAALTSRLSAAGIAFEVL